MSSLFAVNTITKAGVDMDRNQMLEIGKIVNTHGLRGEVKVTPWTDTPNVYESLSDVYCQKKNDLIKLEIKSVKYQKSNLIVKFKQIDNVDDALTYKNTVLLALREDLGELEDGEYYIQDILGLKVITDEGEELGTVTDVLTLPANDVYVVKTKDLKECLLPVIDDVILNVDLEEKVVTVHMLEGLLDV